MSLFLYGGLALCLFFPRFIFANFAYVANSADGTVSVIDTDDNTVVGSPIAVGTSPFAIAITPDGAYAYVTNTGSDSVSVIEVGADVVVDTILVGDEPLGIAITPDGDFAYVANLADNTVSVIRTSDNTVVDEVSVTAGPAGVAMTPNGEYVYVTIGFDNAITRIRTSDNTVVPPTISVLGDPEFIAVAPDGAHVYSSGGARVFVIRTSDNTVTATLTLGFALRSLLVTPDGEYLYVAHVGDDPDPPVSSVFQVSTADNTTVDTIFVDGWRPYGVAITSDGAYLYVTDSLNGLVRVFDTADNSPEASIDVGNTPRGIAITPSSMTPLLPPTNLRGGQKKNDIAIEYSLFNELFWTASASPEVVGYFVYRGGLRIATLNSSTLQYRDPSIQRGVLTQYSVTAFDVDSAESLAASLQIP